MIVSTITQQGYDLTCDINDIPAQFSGNIEFKFIKDSKYESYVAIPHYKYLSNRFLEKKLDTRTFQLKITDGIFKLPPQAFELDGYVAIAFSLSNGDETIQTNPIVYKICATAGSGNILPEENTWQDMVIKVTSDYIDLNVKNTVNELISTSTSHQEQVTNLVEQATLQQDEISSALTNSINATNEAKKATVTALSVTNEARTAVTNATQATQSANEAANSVVIIRNGTTTPTSSLGKSGDYYINTTNGDFYLKNTSSWNKQFNMIALDQTTEIKDAFNSITSLTKQLFLLMHPVGCIYMSTSSTSPQTTFGGTWVRWGNGRVPVGVDTTDTDFDTVEKMAGAKDADLRALIGATGHDVNRLGYAATTPVPGHGVYNINLQASAVSAENVNHSTIVLEADGNTPSRLQPYITCYMWKRTA